MSGIKLIGIDLDDTLLRTDLSISLRTKNVIKKAINKGIAVAICSGRIPESMDIYIKALGLHKKRAFIICSNGTTIIESDTKKVLESVKLNPKTALRAFDLADAEGFAVQLYNDGIAFVSRSNEFTDYDRKLTGLKQIVPEDFRQLIVQHCEKLVIPADPMLLKPFETILRNVLDEEITLFTSKPYFLEILPPNTDKGTALAKAALRLGLQSENVMAIGDSMNDEAMIKWAGCGVAMLNGDDRIKKIARYISEKSNDDDGAALAIERYALTN